VTDTSGHAVSNPEPSAAAQERHNEATWPALRSLRLKLVIAGTALVAVVIGVLTAAGLGIAQRRLEDDLRNTARLTAIAVADDLELRTGTIDSADVTAILHEFLDAAPLVRDISLFTTGAGGTRFAQSTSSAVPAEPDPLVERALQTMRLMSDDRLDQLTAVATPVLRHGQLEGAVLVTASLAPIVRLRNEGRLFAAAIAVFAILGITLIIHLLLAGLERQQAVMREELWRARELATVGQTLADVAHQIGTPLNLASAHVQLLQQEIQHDPGAQRRLGIIATQVERVTTTVRDLLERGRPSKAGRPVALKPLLARLTDSGQVLGATHHVRVTLDAPDDLPAVLADEAQMELALMNLVTNALDAMPAGGQLVVSAAARADGVVVEVRDTGPGIPPELVGRIFDPWMTTKPPGRGTGLGLGITRDVVQRARGTITFEPGLTGGTVFRVTLPPASAGVR
jgi:signal transduction histidine kinase